MGITEKGEERKTVTIPRYKRIDIRTANVRARLVLGLFALSHGFEHHRAQQKHADEVWESHQRVEGVGKNPDQVELGQSADGHDDGVEDTERLQNPIPEQEYRGVRSFWNIQSGRTSASRTPKLKLH